MAPNSCEHARFMLNRAMRKMFKYRLYPTQEQRRLLDQQLEECRWLYNRLLEDRKTVWEQRQESVRLYDQHALLPALKAERPTLARVQSQVLQNVAVRIDLAFKAFFRRVKAGETPGYPRFRGKGRYDSFTFPQVPVALPAARDRPAGLPRRGSQDVCHRLDRTGSGRSALLPPVGSLVSRRPP